MEAARVMNESAQGRREVPLEGRRVVVVGLARTGLATVRFLVSRGAEVLVSDRKSAAELGSGADEVRLLGAALDLGGHTESVFTSADLVIVSPGVPLGLSVLEAARARGIPVLAEVELAWRFLRGRVAGITGSNGKSTTTHLAAAMLSQAGLHARACGNIGTPLVAMVETDTAASVYAVELSSFQLEGILTFRPEAAVVVNLTPDHLDRYRDYAAYAAAKSRIFMNQQRGDIAVLNAADPDSRLLTGSVRVAVRQFSSAGPVLDGAWLRGEEIVLTSGGRTDPLMPVSEVPLPGRHNIENVMAASLAALHLGARPADIRAAVRACRALPHRLELAGSPGGVDYYNDSKATNVASAMMAIGSFPGRRVFLVLGGRDKGGDFTLLRDLLAERVATVFLIGEAAGAIERQIAGAAPVEHAAELGRALSAARAAARPGDVVLLAPACASFDQYRDYEQRGEHFRSLVRAFERSEGEG